MRNILRILCYIAILQITFASGSSGANATSGGDGQWKYPAVNKNWGGQCNVAGNQSPIDLPPFSSAQKQYPLTEFMQYRAVLFDGDTKGQYLKWQAVAGQPAVGYLTHNDVKYNFEHLALHTRSEHTVNGKQYDMELQFYHKSDGGEYAAISVLCSRMPLTEPNGIFKALRTATAEGKTVDIGGFFASLDSSRYFSYPGSITVPPCDEGVTWLVLSTVCSLPEDFWQYVSALPGMVDNYRGPQDAGSREVTTKAAALQAHWHYPADNAVWGGTCARGTQQSPIDLPVTVLSSLTKKSQLLDDLHYNIVDYKGEDLDHGVLFKSDSDMGYLIYNGIKYQLKSVSIHSKSEHTIAGAQFDLEIHFAHQAENSDHMAIIGVLCKSEDFGTSEFFTTLTESMDSTVAVDIKGKFLGRLDTTRYFTYPGSLTSPPCTENVDWLIVGAQCSVPKDYLISLKKYRSMKDNFRPPQPLNERSVETVELEEAIGDEDTEVNPEHIDLAEVPLLGKIGFGVGLFLFCGVVMLRVLRKDPMAESLLHDVDEV